MRVLMLTPDLGFLDRRIAQEAATLARRGWRVDIYPALGELPATTLAPGVQMLPVSHAPELAGPRRLRLGFVKRFLKTAAPPLHRLADAAQHALIDRTRQITDASLQQVLPHGPYGLVIAHDIPVLPLARRLAEVWGSSLVCDLHEIFPEQEEFFSSEIARRYWRSIESSNLPSADGIICVNEAVREYVASRYAPSAPIAVVHNSVPFVERDQLGGNMLRDLFQIPRGRSIAVFAGSLRPDKNLETLIRGFGLARPNGWVLALLGSGAEQDRLQKLIGDMGLGEFVYVGRRVSQDELVRVLSSANLGILPYRGQGLNTEIATPNKLFEYIQARLPIATSRLPMIELLVGSVGNAVFVDFSTDQTTAEGLRNCIARVAELDSSVLEGVARVLSWESDERELLSLVDLAVLNGLRRVGSSESTGTVGASV
jgi:glycosyltransferase involved in cell wall biosynthesis